MSSMGTASFQYASEDPLEFAIESGQTIKSAWNKYAEDVGAKSDRPVTFRAGGVLVSGDNAPQPGQTIIATVTHESKGV